MKRPLLRCALAATALCFQPLAQAQEASAPVDPLPVAELVETRQIDFVSSINGLSYRLQIAIPAVPPPAEGFPVLYALDGNAIFGTLADASRGLALANELAPAVVVGIGYPLDRYVDQYGRRGIDLTPVKDSKLPMRPAGPANEEGGGDLFLRVIDKEIKPRIAQLAPIDQTQETLLGHSLGGLTALRVLFTRPGSFDRYLISSPSIWWHDRYVLEDRAAFDRLAASGVTLPAVMITVGSKEQGVDGRRLPPGMTMETALAIDGYARMVDNSRELAQALEPLYAGQPDSLRFRLYEDETHVSVVWAALNDWLEFALPPAP